jgi:hypothetical protein
MVPNPIIRLVAPKLKKKISDFSTVDLAKESTTSMKIKGVDTTAILAKISSNIEITTRPFSPLSDQI